MKRMWFFWGWTILVLVILNGLVIQKERLLAEGKSILLDLAPRDPRSLMQGDYMVLRYQLSEDVREAASVEKRDGLLVLRPDAEGVARYVRLHVGEALAPGEVLLRYRWRRGVKLGAESFFFPEGQGSRFQQARYGELKVAPSGDAVLVGLRDSAKNLLGVSGKPSE